MKPAVGGHPIVYRPEMHSWFTTGHIFELIGACAILLALVVIGCAIAAMTPAKSMEQKGLVGRSLPPSDPTSTDASEESTAMPPAGDIEREED